MRSSKRWIIAVVLFLQFGCAGVGIVSSSDPLRKLNDAEDLFMTQGRPLPAERLIREAIVIFTERNDSHGLGHAYREYGELLRSPAVSKWEKVYRRDGFQDKSVTFDNRFEKASENFSKALDYYQLAEKPYRDSGKYDELTNVYFNMAWSHFRLNEREKACANYDLTLQSYNENIRLNPKAKPFGSVPDRVTSGKRLAGCA